MARISNKFRIYQISIIAMKCRFVLLAILLATACTATRYCEVQDTKVNIFTPQNEVQQIQLSKHFRGYNLNYESSNPDIVDVYEPYHVAEEAPLDLKAGYLPINVDSRNSKNNLWGRDGVVIAQGEPNSLAVGYGSFKNDVLPTISNFTYFTLPKDAFCYSGHIFDYTFSVVVDCESTSNNEDLLCLLRSDGSQQCQSYDSITQTGKRVNIMHSIDNSQYLFSAATTTQITPAFKNQTYINIYHIRDNGADFNLIVDRRTLGLDSLSITDLALIDLNAVTYVVVADASGKLIMFRYMADNTVGDVKTLNVEGSPRAIEVTPYSEILVATTKQILVYTYTSQSGSITLSKRYEVEPSDNTIIDIQSSINHITVRTSAHNIYTYDRKFTSLRYLLNREEINEGTALVVSPFYPRTFYINGTHMRSVALTPGYLYIKSVDQDTDVTVSGTSGNLTCKISISIKKVADTNKIYNKKQMPTTYRFENEDNLNFNLSDYFGGKNLNYDLKGSKSKDVQFQLEHFKSYKQNQLAIGEDILLYKVVEIDSTSYWFVTFSTEAIRFWLCTSTNSSINCQEDVKSKVPNDGKIIKLAESGRRSDGSLVLIWAYATPMFGYKVLGKSGYSWVMTYDSRYTSVVIGKQFICLVEKEMNRLNFFNGERLYTFAASDFDEDQLQRMGGGFYPRDIYPDPHNPYLFYVKFPVAIVTIAYLGEREIEIITRTQISKDYVPDDQWSLLFGPETVLMFSAGSVAEYAMLPDSSFQLLHNINTDGDAILPATYQQSTNSAIFKTSTGALQYIKLNENSIESQYYKIPGQALQLNNGATWSISESWLYLSSGDVFYQYKTARVTVKSNVPDNLIKQDFTLDLAVVNDADRQEVVSNITAYNYPSVIKATKAKTAVSLPEVGENKIIPFPVDNYFTGSVTGVTISCPFTTDKSITVVPPFQLIKDSDIVKEIYDLVGLPDHSGILTLYNNAITLSNVNNKVINSVGIDSQLSCQWMDVNVKDIVVLCKDDNNQELAWLQLNDDSTDITFKKTYPLPAEATLQNPFEVACYGKGDSLIVALHDKEENVYIESSTIKIVQIDQDLEFKGTYDSTSFGTATVEPLNSVDVRGKYLLVTLGTTGLGYANLENFETSASLINLQNQPDISSYTLENSQFVRVSIHSLVVDKGELSVFLTTSNSLHYLIGLKVQPGGITFDSVKETYNKYGHQRPLNWIAHNDEHVIMAYYNESTSVESMVLYKRGTSKQAINFISSSQFVVPSSNLHTPSSVLIDAQIIGKKSSLLFIEENTKPSAAASLGMYNITGQYGLQVTYKQPGNFDTIKVTAKNDYSTVTSDVNVEFAGKQDGGLKWYSVLIVICLVLIAVGVAFGLYLKMKNRKADSKKVSLFTETEEVDETI